MSGKRMRYALLGHNLALALGGCASAHVRRQPVRRFRRSRRCELVKRANYAHGTDVVVAANADGTAASMRPSGARNAAARNEVLRAVRARSGPRGAIPGSIAHQSKWGLVTWTDRCGRPVAARFSAKPPA